MAAVLTIEDIRLARQNGTATGLRRVLAEQAQRVERTHEAEAESIRTLAARLLASDRNA